MGLLADVRARTCLIAVTGACALTVGCSTAAGPGSGGPRALNVVATINVWGSILQQLGGTHVHATSVITNPATDPHDYEPTPADGRTIATAALLVENGIGYDPWAGRAAAANPDPHRMLLDVGRLVGVAVGGNPHRWYSPSDVERVADAITADLKALDPADAAYFDTQRQAFEDHGLARYHQLISEIRTAYGGTPIGASESIMAPLADGLGLKLVTPPAFLKAISEGSEPSAADKATIDGQISQKKIKVYVFNSQNSTPDVAAQVGAARGRDIPVASITETLVPANASFQDWQVAQLKALQAALHTATGR